MVNLFKKIKASEPNKTGVLNDLERIINNKLHRFATYLSVKTRHIQTSKLVALLYIGCVICLLSITLKTVHSFKDKNIEPFQSINPPVVGPPPAAPIEDVVLLRIKSFHYYMDSLKKNNFLRYDSIIKSRPGLMDSIITVEKFISK